MPEHDRSDFLKKTHAFKAYVLPTQCSNTAAQQSSAYEFQGVHLKYALELTAAQQ